MRSISTLVLMAVIGVTGCLQGWARTMPAPQTATKAGDNHEGQPTTLATDSRSEKQKLLATQAERLFDMATELKAQVDLTNKNILSLKVVQTAEQIEALAKGMRGQARK